jgi:hypothetical protein
VHGRADGDARLDASASWHATKKYLGALARGDYKRAATLLDDAAAREGLGEINGSLADVGRSLLDLVEFDPGTIDVLGVIEALAERAVALAGATPRVDEAQLRSLIVFLGSEGLPCAARSEVASWAPLDRREALVTLVAGLAAFIAYQRGWELTELVDSLEPPGHAGPALGTFGLVWRGEELATRTLAGAIPSGYAPRITFIGEGKCSLRAVFARVAYLREAREGSDAPRQRIGAFTAA